MQVTIHRASPYQAAALTDIAVRAKAHWGYPASQIKQWRQAFLTITPTYIAIHRVWVAVVNDGTLAGFAALEQVLEQDNVQTHLEHLWIRPAFIGRGIGTQLFHHAAATVPEFVFTSDPHADAFYRKLGAQAIGQVDSDMQHRKLTLFRYRPP